MDTETQRSRAAEFRDLHGASEILVLPCAWDAASARLLEEAGFPAIGTTSSGIAHSHGYPDGQHIPRDATLAAIERIAEGVSIPVSADFEAGYAGTVEGVVENVRAAIDAGAVGINFEDGTGPNADPLVDRSFHADAIRAIREMADSAGVPLVVNARTDVYLRRSGDREARFEEAVGRANAYREAGADCLFVPGVGDPDLIRELVEAIDGPINVLASGPDVPPAPELERLGVARVSTGGGLMHAAAALVRRLGEELLGSGTYGFARDRVPHAEMQQLFGSE